MKFEFVPPKLASATTARALVDFGTGPNRARWRGVRAAIALGPARPKFACRIKTGHCKQQWNPERLGNFACKTSDQAPRMMQITININERNIC
jgi:hypothetical protein